jgi:type II secretory ATPase GspE/PulE/Tfp pilus assembly ATPase PilB-like protein
MLIGEIRDFETAEIAIRSALTGHLVFSTLHTNDSTGALTRLTDMGVEPFLVASSVNLVLAQRLLRRLCGQCRRRVELSARVLHRLGLDGEEAQGEYYEAVGCEACHQTGYRGRTGVYEVMPISPALRDMIVRGAPTSEIKAQAMQESMLTLRMDGLLKLKAGITSAEEVLKETAAD